MVTSTYVSSHYAAPQNSEPSNVLHQTPATKLVVNNQELGTGTLYITKNNVTWTSANSTTSLRRISLLYPTISFYGIQKVPVPALYMVINYKLKSMLPELLTHTDDDSDSDDDEEYSITELKFMPQADEDLEAMQSALNDGQAFHPDPADEVTDDEDEGVDIFEEVDESINNDINIDALYLYQLHLNQTSLDYIEEYYEDDEEDPGR